MSMDNLLKSSFLRSVSTADLQTELESRKRQASMSPPVKPNPDFGPLIKTVTDGVAESIKTGYEDDDFKHYVYEAAMTAIYGKEYWDWRRLQNW